MNMWDRELKTILDTNRFLMEAKFRYMDDWRGLPRALSPGWRWEDGRMMFRKEWVEEDCSLSPTQRTCRELNKLMYSIYPNLKYLLIIPR